jgi:DNA repair ATPase RecN
VACRAGPGGRRRGRNPAPHDRPRGRSRSFINGRAATLAQLREAGEWLVDIHGQHAHQSLLRASGQRELLDAYAGAEELRDGCGAAWRAWQRLEALAREAEQRFALRAAERAELEEKVAELRKLGVRVGEWDELSTAQRRLAHGSALLAGAQSSLEALAEAEGASLPQLAAVASRLRALSEHDDGLKPIVELLASAAAQAGEAARELRQYASRVELDPAAVRATSSGSMRCTQRRASIACGRRICRGWRRNRASGSPSSTSPRVRRRSSAKSRRRAASIRPLRRSSRPSARAQRRRFRAL